MKAKTINVRWRVCNCTDFVLREGIMRTLLASAFPSLNRLNKVPCQHWESGKGHVPANSRKLRK